MGSFYDYSRAYEVVVCYGLLCNFGVNAQKKQILFLKSYFVWDQVVILI